LDLDLTALVHQDQTEAALSPELGGVWRQAHRSSAPSRSGARELSAKGSEGKGEDGGLTEEVNRRRAGPEGGSRRRGGSVASGCTAESSSGDLLASIPREDGPWRHGDDFGEKKEMDPPLIGAYLETARLTDDGDGGGDFSSGRRSGVQLATREGVEASWTTCAHGDGEQEGGEASGGANLERRWRLTGNGGGGARASLR